MLIEFVFRNCVFKLKAGTKDKNFVGLHVALTTVYVTEKKDMIYNLSKNTCR